MKKVILIMLAVVFLSTVCYAKGSGSEDKSKSADEVEAVDLGLSVKWANMNVGAKKASGYGKIFGSIGFVAEMVAMLLGRLS